MYLYMNILGFCCEKLHTNIKVNKNKYASEWMNYLKEEILITITGLKSSRQVHDLQGPFLTTALPSLFSQLQRKHYIHLYGNHFLECFTTIQPENVSLKAIDLPDLKFCLCIKI